jgi:hypothetical protein
MSSAPLLGGLYVGQPSGGGSSSQIANTSDVPGATVSDALNALYRVGYPVDQTGATYTFALTDRGRTVPANRATAQTFTLPPAPGIAWQVGDVITVWQKGDGRVTFAQGAGVTILPSQTYQPATLEKNAQVTAQYVALNTWLLSGDRLPV